MIRRATAADKMVVIRLIKSFCTATPLLFPFRADLAERLFLDFLDAPNRLLLLSDKKGVLFGEVVEHRFGFMIANEVLWWVDPQARGRASIQMLEMYEQWAAEQGCRFVHVSQPAGTNDTLRRFYGRRGYAQAETHFMKAINR